MIPERPSKKLIISNLKTDSGKVYEVVCDGLIPGALQYIDRDYTFESVAPLVNGQTYIKTAGNDKLYEEEDMWFSFDVNQDVTVYVLHADKIHPKPAWLKEFTNTREKVTRRNDPTTKGTFTLFAKDFPKGTITLGGDFPEGWLTPEFIDSLGSGYCMYSVVVTPKEDEHSKD